VGFQLQYATEAPAAKPENEKSHTLELIGDMILRKKYYGRPVEKSGETEEAAKAIGGGVCQMKSTRKDHALRVGTGGQLFFFPGR